MYWSIVFILSFAYRFLRLIVNRIAVSKFRPIPIPKSPSLNSKDVTVVIPTLDGDGNELRRTLRSVLASGPQEIMLVTVEANTEKARIMLKELGMSIVRVLSVPHPNKRIQMAKAIPEIRTEITIFADDDVSWPTTLLPWMLSPFEDSTYGGVGTNQRVIRAAKPTFSQNLWAYLNCLYLERRNFDCAACSHMDGGVPCLSGRTVAYRTSILRDDAFIAGLKHEVWLGRYQLSVDDDNFITRWLVSHGHKIAFQWHEEAEVLTTLEDNSMFLKQCLRWSRSNWRSNITSMFVERIIWSEQPWSTYAVHLTTLSHWALIWDCWMVYCCISAFETDWRNQMQSEWIVLSSLLVWMLLSKVIKFPRHYARYPSDLCLVPVSILFGWLHGLIKLNALLTVTMTTWGSREGADSMDGYRMMRVTVDERKSVETLMIESSPMPLNSIAVDRSWKSADQDLGARISSSTALPLLAYQCRDTPNLHLTNTSKIYESEKPPAYV
ncbi:hypothetical protein MMC25_003301 [Agyrium rufum]|nr:hypothetical protein [Agyrium rufum]